jgi:hypothetical protein
LPNTSGIARRIRVLGPVTAFLSGFGPL